MRMVSHPLINYFIESSIQDLESWIELIDVFDKEVKIVMGNLLNSVLNKDVQGLFVALHRLKCTALILKNSDLIVLLDNLKNLTSNEVSEVRLFYFYNEIKIILDKELLSLNEFRIHFNSCNN